MPKEKQKSNISKATGEIIEDAKTAKENIEYINETIKELQGNRRDIKRAFGLDSNELVNQKRFFYKLYKTDWELINSFSMSTYKILMFMIMNIHYKDNSVTINDKNITYSEMALICDVSLSTFKRAIKELQGVNMVKIERKGLYNVIYFNPLYIEDSKTEKSIYTKFEG